MKRYIRSDKEFLTNPKSKEVIFGIENALNISVDIAEIIAKWYAEGNPDDWKTRTVSEYVQYISNNLENDMYDLHLNEGMSGIRDYMGREFAEEFVQVADALDIEFNEDW